MPSSKQLKTTTSLLVASVALLTFIAVVVSAKDVVQSSSSSSSEEGKCSAAEHLVFEDCFIDCEDACNETGPRKDCPTYCKPGGGCRCADGYIRKSSAPNAPCVPKGHCNCNDANEVFAECEWGKCQSTCANPVPFECYRTMGVSPVCFKGSKVGTCLCRDGFIRDDSNACVPESDCPEAKAKMDEWRKKFAHLTHSKKN